MKQDELFERVVGDETENPHFQQTGELVDGELIFEYGGEENG